MAIPIEIVTFVISFFVGISGAGIYLLMLLMADRKVEILENPMLPLPWMTALFVIAGGLVAGLFQTATGSPVAATNLQNVFMIGFGWQGAIAGIGASGRVKAGREEIGEGLDLVLSMENP